MNDRERRVRDEAHRIWIEEGRPEGAEQRHWTEAEKRVSAADSADEAAARKPKGEKRQKPPKPGPKGAAGAIGGDVGKARAGKAAGKQAEALVTREPSSDNGPEVEGAAAAPAPGPAGGKRKADKMKADKAKAGAPVGKVAKAAKKGGPERRPTAEPSAKPGKSKA